MAQGVGFAPTAPGVEPDELSATPPLRRNHTANSIGRHGFLGGAVDFAGIAFGAAAFLGFFFSLLRALLPFPIVVASIRD